MLFLSLKLNRCCQLSTTQNKIWTKQHIGFFKVIAKNNSLHVLHLWKKRNTILTFFKVKKYQCVILTHEAGLYSQEGQLVSHLMEVLRVQVTSVASSRAASLVWCVLDDSDTFTFHVEPVCTPKIAVISLYIIKYMKLLGLSCNKIKVIQYIEQTN